MSTGNKKSNPLKIILWVVGLAPAGAIGILFWPYIGLLAAVVIPLLIIGSIIRSLVRDLPGKRETYTVTYGTVGLSDLPKNPKCFRHFTTRNDNNGE